MNKKILLSTVALGALVVAGVVAWNQYAKVKIREVVDASFDRAEAYFAAMNVQAEFSYDDVTVSTFSIPPHASVQKVRVELSSPEGSGEMVTLLVPEVVYKPKNLTLSAYQLELLDAISVQMKEASGETSKALVEFGANPRLVVDEERDGAVAYDLNVSDRMEYVPVDEEGNPQDNGEHMVLNFAAAPELKWSYNAQGMLALKKASIPATVMEMAGQKVAQWTSLNGKVEYQYPDGAEIGFYAVGEAQEFQLFTPEWQRINPVNTAYEISYLGADLANPESEAADGKVEIKSFSFVSPVASVFSNGEFAFDLNEGSLPVGSLSLRIDQLDKLLPFIAELDELGASFEPIAREYLAQLQGSPVEGESVGFTVSRKEGDRVFIGKLNMEDAIGSGLQALFKLHQANEAAKGKAMDDAEETAQPESAEEPAAPASVADEVKKEEPKKEEATPKVQPVEKKAPEVKHEPKNEAAPAVAAPVQPKEETAVSTPTQTPLAEVKEPVKAEGVVIETPAAQVKVEVTEKPVADTEAAPAEAVVPAQ